MILIVMGVSGSGKSRIGELLAVRLVCSFVDGDAFHSIANKEKMAHGIPLTDADRWPWLTAIRTAIEAKLHAGENAVFGCSSLKRVYRDVLRGMPRTDDVHGKPRTDDVRGVPRTNDMRGSVRADDVRFVYLQGSFELLRARLGERTGHFFDPSLLQNQLDTLEEPAEDEATTVSIELTPEAIIDTVLASLK